MNQSSHSGHDTVTTIFCAGCNERFEQQTTSDICPRCGALILPNTNALLDQTVLHAHPYARRISESSQEFASVEELDRLIGAELDVYHCESLLGSGGMGRVYLARHKDLHRRCALKVLSPRQATKDTDYITRFLQEGQAAAALNHPNIVTTHAVGKADKFHFLEMEFVAGRSLQQLIDDEGQLTPIRSTSLTAKVSEGLAAAHREGIIHRDLKPDNILLTHHGVPKITDFGLAKRVLADDTGPASEPLCGTPNYMAPELLRGEKASPCSDVYALGVCYFQMLTGRLPFVANSLRELLKLVATQSVPRVRDTCPAVSLEMAECLNLLMAQSPANRPQDAIEASQLLQAVLGQVKDLESLLREAFRDESGIHWSRNGEAYRLELQLSTGRHQTLFVEPSEHAAAERLLIIYSICCKAQPEYYEQALRLNSEMPHGGLAIRESDGESKFVVIDTYPRATVDAEEIRRSVLEIAMRADAVEKLLTGLDVY